MSTINTTLFAKRRTNKEGKKFYTYLATLTRKDGTPVTVSVKFAEVDAPKPENCPCSIIIDRAHCNMAKGSYIDKNGNEQETWTMWVKSYEMGTPFVDTSMDDFE